ncbi:MAG: bifunctional nicotinamidase/pyrazinamidase [Alphaproteobacteria bacterium]|jgi:nicotinamidase/pyrazinamidase|nr:bifunctional nicotinamidase/pyrazinamidase [Alphaproteobacteria bacterium]MBT5860980.1 bifunctional nicotinamidase/pyrazinamidase [Alphaproteobacteria bacterium]
MPKSPPENSALLIIDLQNDFCSGGGLAVPGGEEIVATVNRLGSGFSATVLTQDWHPAGHSSFASAHPGASPYALTEAAYGPQVLWPDHCIQGTDGAEFHGDLDTTQADLIVRKGFRPSIDSYSAFQENDRQTSTGLAGYLRDRGIKHVTLCGLALDFCVKWSALDAVTNGFAATVLTDVCRAIDLDGSKTTAESEMAAAGVTLATSDALL